MRVQIILKSLFLLWIASFHLPSCGKNYSECDRICGDCSPRCLAQCSGWSGLKCGPSPESLCAKACGSQTTYDDCNTCLTGNSDCKTANITMTTLPSSGFSGCTTAQSQFSTCQSQCAACSSSITNTSAMTACLGAPCNTITEITNSTTYKTCSTNSTALNACETACQGATTYEECMGSGCATNSNCTQIGINATNLASQSYSWLSTCKNLLTQGQDCTTACNNKNCSQCLASECAADSTVTSSSGYQACNACANACNGAPSSGGSTIWTGCSTCASTCASNGITPTTTGAPSGLALCNNYSTCDSGCASGSSTVSGCQTCLNNSACSATNVTATSIANMTIPSTYSNLTKCQNELSSSSCIAACASAPSSASTAATDASWNQCSNCSNICAKANITSSSSNAPVGLQACQNTISACGTGCANAANDLTGQQCISCLRSPACNAAGIQVSNDNGAPTSNVSSVSGAESASYINSCNTVFNNIGVCTNAVNSASNNYTSCMNAISGSCGSIGVTTSNVASKVSSLSFLNECSTAISYVNSCLSACSNAPNGLVSSTSSQWNSCASCLQSCSELSSYGVSPGQSPTPAALTVCTSANYLQACQNGCSGAASDGIGNACNTCLNSYACALVGINVNNISNSSYATGSNASSSLGLCATLYSNINICGQSCATAGQSVLNQIQSSAGNSMNACYNNNLCVANSACQKLGLGGSNISTFAQRWGSNFSTCANAATCASNCENAYNSGSATNCSENCFGSSACQQLGLTASVALNGNGGGNVFEACANLIQSASSASQNVQTCQQAITAAATDASQCQYVLGSNSGCQALGINEDTLITQQGTYPWLSMCQQAIVTAQAQAEGIAL